MNEPIWIITDAVLKIHDYQLAQYGGLEGVRDENLLNSAVTRPQNLFAYGQPNIFELAATLTFGLAKNHPFNDANKRTAYVSGRTFLDVNGYKVIAPQEEKLTQMIALAEGLISEKEFAVWLENNSVKK